MSFSFGKGYLDKLVGFDIIFRSPSCLPTVPELVKEAERGAIITTEIEMVIELCPCLVIGITGSDGKTTTTQTGFKPNQGKTETTGIRNNQEAEPIAKVELDSGEIIYLNDTNFGCVHISSIEEASHEELDGICKLLMDNIVIINTEG